MTLVLRLFVLGLLGTTVWWVQDLRHTLAADDADPAAVADLKARLDSLPRVVANGRYRGRDHPMDEDIVRESGADTFASVIYADGAGNEFHLYVGGAIGNQENFHAPAYCMPASGWEILDESTVPFRAYGVEQGDPHQRRLLLQYGTRRMLVYYWFQAGARITDHDLKVRLYRFWDLLNGEPLRPTLIVTLYVPVRGEVAKAEAAAAEFVRAVGPDIHAAIAAGG